MQLTCPDAASPESERPSRQGKAARLETRLPCGWSSDPGPQTSRAPLCLSAQRPHCTIGRGGRQRAVGVSAQRWVGRLGALLGKHLLRLLLPQGSVSKHIPQLVRSLLIVTIQQMKRPRLREVRSVFKVTAAEGQN